jgi:TrmH family RNA methyltransferase
MINSPRNPRLKELKRLRRRRERDHSLRFVVEGEDLIEAARLAGRQAVSGYRVPGTGVGEASFIDVEPQLLAEVSLLGSGTRAIGVYEQRFIPAPVGPLCVYLHGVADPGNVGTILRAAEAFGASCVALGADCADPHAPKAVRASMGAIFAVALARVEDIAELPGERVALVARAGQTLRDLRDSALSAHDSTGSIREGPGEASPGVGPGRPMTLLIGAERRGLPPAIVAACEHVAHIPIRSQSLNAAMAATVALYEMSDHNGGGARRETGNVEGSDAAAAGRLRHLPGAPPSRVPPA